MTERIIVAGSGGQGIMLLGKIIAESAMNDNKFVTWLPAYGAEVRGGTAHCALVISDREIGSPYVDKADTMIIMNQLSLDKFSKRLKKNGILIFNSSLAKAPEELRMKVVSAKFSDVALELGNIKVANMVALGFCLAHKKIVSLESVLSVIRSMAPRDKPELVEINQKALKNGVQL